MAVAGLAFPSLSALLAACGDGSGAGGDAQVVIGTPANPATQPMVDSNPMIADGLPSEEGPLKLYNWDEYINLDMLDRAKQELGADIEVTTFYNEEQAIQKLVAGEVDFDVWFPTQQTVPKSVAGQLIRPLNHSYLPNLANVWPSFQSPFYDVGSQYTVPYVLYQTGIAWRVDQVDSADIEELENPWEVFWNTKYKGIVGLYDDITETLPFAMFRDGVTDLQDVSQAELDAGANALSELVGLMNVRYSIDGSYAGIPEGRFGLHLSWAGDMVNVKYYAPTPEDAEQVRYLWPPKAANNTQYHAMMASDTMTVLKGGKNPVLAHKFLNWLLDYDNSLENFSFVAYQPPQAALDPETLVADGWVPEWLESAIIRESDFDDPLAVLPRALAGEEELAWNDAWQRAQSGATIEPESEE
jgi:spermidine/putrescine transport system substrate-binding protein